MTTNAASDDEIYSFWILSGLCREIRDGTVGCFFRAASDACPGQGRVGNNGQGSGYPTCRRRNAMISATDLSMAAVNPGILSGNATCTARYSIALTRHPLNRMLNAGPTGSSAVSRSASHTCAQGWCNPRKNGEKDANRCHARGRAPRRGRRRKQGRGFRL